MPTRSDFEAAAEKFSAAADLVDQLSTSASGAGAAQILRGGSLGRRVPEVIETSVQAAASCSQSIDNAAEICLQRAAIIADYELRLDAYDRAHSRFEQATRAFGAQFNAWFLDDTGTVDQPSNPPQPPTKPTPPPAWAEVRRP